jgi:hypothetical protein
LNTSNSDYVKLSSEPTTSFCDIFLDLHVDFATMISPRLSRRTGSQDTEPSTNRSAHSLLSSALGNWRTGHDLGLMTVNDRDVIDRWEENSQSAR